MGLTFGDVISLKSTPFTLVDPVCITRVDLLGRRAAYRL